jgi:hypothetical protein
LVGKVFRVGYDDEKLTAATVTGLKAVVAVVAQATFTTRLEFGGGETSDSDLAWWVLVVCVVGGGVSVGWRCWGSGGDCRARWGSWVGVGWFRTAVRRVWVAVIELLFL